MVLAKSESDDGPPVVRLEAELAAGAGLRWLICDGTEIDTALNAYELGEQADLMLVGAGRRALVGEQELVDDFPDQIVDEVLDTGLTGVKTDFRSRLDGRQFIVLTLQALFQRRSLDHIGA